MWHILPLTASSSAATSSARLRVLCSSSTFLIYCFAWSQVLVLLTRVRDGNHLLSTSIVIPPRSPSVDSEIEAAFPASYASSASKNRSSMVLSASMARTRRRRDRKPADYNRICSFSVQKTTRYLTYLNEGSITFKVKVGWRAMAVRVWAVGRWARACL